MNKVIGRIYSYDIMRFVAILAVIMIHTSAIFVISSDGTTADFVLANVLDSLSRFSVPLFLMISGALMLNEKKEIDNKKIFRSAAGFFVLLVVWSIIYSLYDTVLLPYLSSSPISIKSAILSAIKGYGHLWYLYVTVGLYLITPVLRLFVKLKNNKTVKYFLILSVAVCFATPFVNTVVSVCLPGNSFVSQYVSKFELGFLTEYLTYYILGWYLSNIEIKKHTRIWIYVAGAAGLIITVVGTHLFYHDSGADFYSYSMLNILAYSTSVFVFIFYLLKKKDLSKHKKLLTAQSGLTFGVYLIHCIFISVFERLSTNLTATPLKILIIFTGTAICSFASVFIISKIPLIRKLVRG